LFSFHFFFMLLMISMKTMFEEFCIQMLSVVSLYYLLWLRILK